MKSHVIDSDYLSRTWRVPEVANIFDDDSRLQYWLDVEACLARVQGELGVIPKDVAEVIVLSAKVEKMDKVQYDKHAAGSGHSLIPMIRCLQTACGEKAGEFVHFGTTTQDIIDTASILQMRDAARFILAQTLRLEKAILEQAKRYRMTVMAGRTHGQHGSPITLGFKFAGWAAELRRDIERMKAFPERVFFISMHGSVGTQAGLGEKAMQVAEGMARELHLTMPPIGWGTARDGIAEYLSTFGILAGTLGRIANEIYASAATELGELREPLKSTAVGSSTMPHKRNPAISESVVAQSRIVQSNAMLGMLGQISEHERDLSSWRAEIHNIPETCILLGRMVKVMADVVEKLDVDEKAIARNLNCLGGLLLTESVMFALADKMGKQTAHELLRELTVFQKDDLTFIERLHANAKVKAVLTDEQIDALFDYSKFIGRAPVFVDEVVQYCEEASKTDPDPKSW